MFLSEVLAVASLHKMSILAHKSMPILQNRIQVRSLRSRFKKQKANPGVENRLQNLNYTDKDSVSQEELDEMENSEPDFMSVHLTQREVEREMKKAQRQIRERMLEKKYFKQSLEPALLTWEEKEQIRHLHQLNPEKWNIQTLAESFPTTKSAIEKILKTKWIPTSVDRIIKYNKMVEKNWKMLYEGKLDIPDETRAHFARFSSRKEVTFSSTETYKMETTLPNITSVSREFSNILQPSQELIADPLQKIKQSFAQNPLQKVPEDETYVIDDDKRRSQTPITLNMYREKILRTGKELCPIDKAMMDSYKSSFEKETNSKKTISSNDFGVDKFNKYAVEVKQQQNTIRGQINIPPHLKGKGTLYKLDDCYYDEDGELLYRVPGME